MKPDDTTTVALDADDCQECVSMCVEHNPLGCAYEHTCGHEPCGCVDEKPEDCMCADPCWELDIRAHEVAETWHAENSHKMDLHLASGRMVCRDEVAAEKLLRQVCWVLELTTVDALWDLLTQMRDYGAAHTLRYRRGHLEDRPALIAYLWNKDDTLEHISRRLGAGTFDRSHSARATAREIQRTFPLVHRPLPGLAEYVREPEPEVAAQDERLAG